MVQATLDRWKRIDILVNVAGGADRKPVIDMTAADWDHIIDMNLKSVFLCSQAVLPTMLKQHYGKIVNISSIYGFTGNATRSSYAAAKAGVAVFTKSLALEVARTASISMPIAPGRIAHRQRARPLQRRSLGRTPSRKFPWIAPARRKKSPAPRSSSLQTKTNTSPAKPFTSTAPG